MPLAVVDFLFKNHRKPIGKTGIEKETNLKNKKSSRVSLPPSTSFSTANA
jgi:hypothetical protein